MKNIKDYYKKALEAVDIDKINNLYYELDKLEDEATGSKESTVFSKVRKDMVSIISSFYETEATLAVIEAGSRIIIDGSKITSPQEKLYFKEGERYYIGFKGSETAHLVEVVYLTDKIISIDFIKGDKTVDYNKTGFEKLIDVVEKVRE